MKKTLLIILAVSLCSCATYEYTTQVAVKSGDDGVAAQLRTLLSGYDDDADGLPNDLEAKYGTNPTKADTDGDGLSDYDEITKYHTNPLKADSDGDGIPDGMGDERREYAYTIRAICWVNAPYSTESMTDHFQDYVVLQASPGRMVYQVTFYPESHHILEALPLSVEKKIGRLFPQYLQETPTQDYDAAMATDVRAALGVNDSSTDLQVLRNLLRWNDQVWKPAGSFPAPFMDLYFKKDGTFGFNNRFNSLGPDPGPREATDRKWQLQHIVLGKESFYNRSHGSCGSTANLFSTMLRSIGIPTRFINSVPFFDPEVPAQRAMVGALSDPGMKKLAKEGVSYQHVQCEAFVGGKWLRIDNWGLWEHLRTTEFGGSVVRCYQFPDWKDAKMSTWVRGDSRPYGLIKIEEQQPIHHG